MHHPPLILASASPRRAALLREAGLEFRIVIAKVPETHPDHFSPSESARYNARRKAISVALRHPHCLVLGADTVVSLDRTILGKPGSIAEAASMLAQLAGKSHLVITGVCMIHLESKREACFADVTRVHFRPLTPAQIRDYLERIDPLDKAGAYAIQEQGDLIVDSIEGSFANVVGLPLERVLEALRRWHPAR
ncbi:MAG TPA: Maf family protein [Candidatus Paceibacterota bacterium]|nr:septum formation protein Maf [Verrucomicrobiota bacterium]HOX04159.1 Maf family protein [Verrucomicrobiota bacterium]HRZ47060.1 Maf family protein [Candidatus Paceibacterota bacterium]HRZ92792.1 Maf family protein [Candidatus Paceibacterota bacterium]